MDHAVLEQNVFHRLTLAVTTGWMSTLAYAAPVVSADPVGAAGAVASTTSARPVHRVERIELSAGFYLLARPAGYKQGDRPPLIVCLHETETGAATILEFWRRLATPIGMVLAAPEHHMPGWREIDLPCIRAMLSHLRRHVTYDPQRVLLAGYSAGGAMAMHLLYVEDFPATAVAGTANYVPPSVTRERVAARRDVPIFYAVGTRDINYDRMRASLELLQANGGTLTLVRPDIGHRLDPGVGQQAMDWFVRTATRQALGRIDQAAEMAQKGRYAAGLAVVEPILAQRAWHPPEVVERAAPVRDTLERPGRKRLAEATHLTSEDRSEAAVDVLRRIEEDYGASQLGDEARRRRMTLEADPKVSAALKARQADETEQAARRSLVRAQRLVVKRQYDQAKRQCRSLIKAYPGSTAAARARTLLEQLREAGR